MRSNNQILTNLLPDKNNTAVRLLISGEVTGIGFPGWLNRRARANNLKSTVREKRNRLVEAILIGSQQDLDVVVRFAWKGPQHAKVEKVIEFWFNRAEAQIDQQSNNHCEEYYEWSKGTAEIIRTALGLVSSIMDQPNNYTRADRVSGTDELLKEAMAHNLFASKYINKELYVFSPSKEIGFQRSQTTNVSSAIHALIDHKDLTKQYLSKKGFPVPRGDVFINLMEAREYLALSERSLVAKPAVGLNGVGVTVDIRTAHYLEDAWEYAKSFHEQIILEEMVEGVDIRVIVIGGQARTAYLRIPANVIGDGIKTIEMLVDEKNKQRLNNPRLRKTPIIPDNRTRRYLERQGFDYNSIPQKGEIVFFHLKANISQGGDTINITNFIHADLMKLAEEVVKAVELNDFCGLDLLVERIDLPRDKQKCVIIELNSTANIESTNYPFYGQRYNAARALIEYLFPENINDHDYPVDNVRVDLTGVLGHEFLSKVKQLSMDFNLHGSVRTNKDMAEIILKGRKHCVTFLIDSLIGWEVENGEAVDGILVSPYNDEVKNGFHIQEEKIDSYGKSYDKSTGLFKLNLNKIQAHDFNACFLNGINDLNINLFSNAYKSNGFASKELYNGLFELRNETLVGFSSMYHSSLFCDNICDRRYPARKLLAINGLPVPRGVRLKSSRIENAIYHFERFSSACLVTILNPGVTEQYIVQDPKQIERICKIARKKGSGYLLLEERIEGYYVCVAVVGKEAAGSLIITPAGIKGDGRSTIRELIDEKNYQRSLNPWYRHFPIDEDKCLLDVLTRTGHRQEDILPEEETLLLETEIIYEYGGETYNIEDILHHDFKIKAVQAVNAIPGLEFAYVYMILPRPDISPEEQRWAILNIDTNPKVAIFQFPWRGEPCNVAEKVVADLCLTERALWI